VLPLDLVRVLVVAIDEAPDAERLERWARWLADGHAADPAAPDLLAWIAKRPRELAEPSPWSPVERAHRATL
jgi:hypothetical protein